MLAHSHFAVMFPAAVLLALLAGYLLGLRGYAQATRDAHTRILAAMQRSNPYIWPDSAP